MLQNVWSEAPNTAKVHREVSRIGKDMHSARGPFNRDWVGCCHVALKRAKCA